MSTQFTIEQVAARLSLSDRDPEYRELSGIMDAVGAAVASWTGIPTPDLWPADIDLGAAMLAARLHRRRNSPAGVEAFNDMGAVYVSRRDPDIAMLLGLGDWIRPKVG